jgi:hypothetical protein
VRKTDVGHEGHAEACSRCSRRCHRAWRQPHAGRDGPLDAPVIPGVRGLSFAGFSVVERLHVLQAVKRRG